MFGMVNYISSSMGECVGFCSNRGYRKRQNEKRYIPFRILVADDNSSWRKALRGLLELSYDWIVFEASNGYDAVHKAQLIHPDVVILDFLMPVLNGLQAARELKRITPDLPVLIVTLDKTHILELAAEEAGVFAVLSKAECGILPTLLQRQMLARTA